MRVLKLFKYALKAGDGINRGQYDIFSYKSNKSFS